MASTWRSWEGDREMHMPRQAALESRGRWVAWAWSMGWGRTGMTCGPTVHTVSHQANGLGLSLVIGVSIVLCVCVG